MSAPTTPNNNRSSMSRRRTGGGGSSSSNSCFHSLVIYNPNLSQGKEDRAMDNILFFYPPTVHPNQQMNHVGMCIAVMCFTERFQPTNGPPIQADEIRTDYRCITVFSPAPNFYMALEADELYDASIVTPLLRKAFAAFTIRHGLGLFCDETRSDESQAVMKSFFTNYCRFMESSVMNMGASSSDRQLSNASERGGAAPSSGNVSPRGTPGSEYDPSSPTSTTPSALRTSRKFDEGINQNSSRASSLSGTAASPAQRRRFRWEAEALSESLLHSPLRLHSSTGFQYQTCTSIVAQYLSLITAQCPRSSKAFVSRWKDDNDSFTAARSTPPPLAESKKDDCNLERDQPSSPVASAPPQLHFPQHPNGCDDLCSVDRCMWSGIQCLLLRREDRRLLMSTCGDFLAAHLAYLSMIEPDLTSFILKGDVFPSYNAPSPPLSGEHQLRSPVCSVHSVDDVIVFLIVEDSVQEKLFTSIDVVASQLARELSEWLRKGTCTLLRQSAPSATSLLSLVGAAASSPRQSMSRTGSVSFAAPTLSDRSPVLQQPQPLGTPSSSTMTAALREGASWVCWNNNVVHGATLAHYPQLVQWTLGSLLREAIASATAAHHRRLLDMPTSQSAVASAAVLPFAGFTSSPASKGGALVARKQWLATLEAQSLPGKEFVECWIPLGSDGWLFVCQRNGRVVGVPYYSTSSGNGLNYLYDCFAMADKTTQKLFHGAHFLAPPD